MCQIEEAETAILIELDAEMQKTAKLQAALKGLIEAFAPSHEKDFEDMGSDLFRKARAAITFSEQ